MDVNRLTQKSQEALSEAQSTATRMGHTEVDGEHLLLALLEQAEGITPRLLDQLGVDIDALRAAVNADLRRRPRVTGPGAAPGQVYLTQRLARLLDTADREARRLKDEYVSVEHLVLALAEEGSASAAGRRLAEHGVTGRRCCPPSPRSGATNGSPRPPLRGPTRRWRSTARTWSWPPGRASLTR